ncbi:MAG: DnaB-like helicase C-terminal domain-containing protein [Candidatus Thorarchaeota archaeon]|jgi:replicative DNA helicase
MANIAAEFGLLAGLCRNPDVFFNIQKHLSVDDFTDKVHQKFFIVLQRLLMNTKGQLVVTQPGLMAEATALGFKDFFEICRDGELIEACLDHESSQADTGRAFLQVKRESVKKNYRGALKKLEKYVQETPDDTSDIINKVDTTLIDLSNKLQGVVDDEIIHLPKRALEIIDDLANHPGELGVDIGFPIWQRAIGGLRNGSMTFLAATAKAGKSQIGVRAAVELSRYMPVLYCDSELNEIAQGVRAFGMHTEVNYEILETGYWKADYHKIVRDGYDKTFALQCGLDRQVIEDEDIRAEFAARKLYYKQMTGMTAREMLPFLRRWVMQHAGLDNETRQARCLIVWDYIKLARIDQVKDMGVGAHDVLGDTCMALHDFAEEFNLPILAFGQTNRVIDKDFAMIAGAKKIVELVDSISLWHQKDVNDLVNSPHGTHEIHILGSRYGKGVSTHINVDADLGIGKFKELGVASFAPPTPAAPPAAPVTTGMPNSTKTKKTP